MARASAGASAGTDHHGLQSICGQLLPARNDSPACGGFAQGRAARRMTATCRLAAILVADVAGESIRRSGQLA